MSELETLISKLELFPLDKWKPEKGRSVNRVSFLRSAVEIEIEQSVYKIRNEGDSFTLEHCDLETNQEYYWWENIKSQPLIDTYKSVMRRDNPYFIQREQEIKDFEKSLLKELSGEMIEKLIRADEKYSERSYLYYKDFDNKEEVYKEHRYFDKNYFDKIELGSTGYLIREYVGRVRFLIYNCEVVKKDNVNQVVVFKVWNQKHCEKNILDKLQQQTN